MRGNKLHRCDLPGVMSIYVQVANSASGPHLVPCETCTMTADRVACAIYKQGILRMWCPTRAPYRLVLQKPTGEGTFFFPSHMPPLLCPFSHPPPPPPPPFFFFLHDCPLTGARNTRACNIYASCVQNTTRTTLYGAAAPSSSLCSPDTAVHGSVNQNRECPCALPRVVASGPVSNRSRACFSTSRRGGSNAPCGTQTSGSACLLM